MNQGIYKSAPAPKKPLPWLVSAVATAERSLGVGILAFSCDELPSHFDLRGTSQSLSGLRRDYLEERIRDKFGRQPFAYDDLYDMADMHMATLFTDRKSPPSSVGPFGRHRVTQPVEHAVIILESTRYDARDEQAACYRLEVEDIVPAPDVSIQRNSIRHELGHLGLRCVANAYFTRKHDELSADHAMTGQAATLPCSPTEAQYSHDWRLLSNMASSVKEFELPYYNSLSLRRPSHSPQDAYTEIAATLELKEALRAQVTGQPSPLASIKSIYKEPRRYVDAALYGHEGHQLRQFYEKDMPPTRAMALALATQSVTHSGFALAATEELAHHIKPAAQRRIRLDLVASN